MNPETRGRTSTDCTASRWPLNSSQSVTSRSTAGATVTSGVIITGLGVLHAATDWPDYAEQMAAVFGAEPLLEPSERGFAMRPVTKFESRGQRLGHSIRDLFFRRRT